MQTKSFSHSHGESNFHIVYCPKYRHPVFAGRILAVCIFLINQVCEKWSIGIKALRVNADHIHIFISLTSWQSPSFAVHKLKGTVACEIFKRFPYLKEWDPVDKIRFWGGHLWSRGYFFRSVGSTTNEAVEFYIKLSQDKHLCKKYYTFVSGKRKVQAESNNDPFIDFLQGKIVPLSKDQRKLSDF